MSCIYCIYLVFIRPYCILIHHLSPYFKVSTDILIQTENWHFDIKIFKICLSILWKKNGFMHLLPWILFFYVTFAALLIYCCMFCHPGLIFYGCIKRTFAKFCSILRPNQSKIISLEMAPWEFVARANWRAGTIPRKIPDIVIYKFTLKLFYLV